MESKKPTRKGSTPIKVYCLPDERAGIEANARQARKSVACYLREVGLGYRLHSAVDLDAVHELARINGDLGRLGGLLKLWLAADARTARFTPATVQVLLERIAAQQDELGKVMEEVVRPRGRT